MIGKQVELSAWSRGVTIFVNLLCLGVMIFWCLRSDHELELYIVAAAYAAINLASLFYAPREIELTDNGYLIVRFAARIKRIPVSSIRRICLVSPTMSERRLFASGGYYGYWGWFSEATLGRYFAYYGKASDCFLVKLDDGRKYMLGCQDPAEIVEAITRQLDRTLHADA